MTAPRKLIRKHAPNRARPNDGNLHRFTLLGPRRLSIKSRLSDIARRDAYIGLRISRSASSVRV